MLKTHLSIPRVVTLSFVLLALTFWLAWCPASVQAQDRPQKPAYDQLFLPDFQPQFQSQTASQTRPQAPSYGPELVPLDHVVQVGAGAMHTCVLTTWGGVKCWGANSAGQLGDGTAKERNLPVDVMGLNRGVAAIAVGEQYTCALTDLGGVKCWGQNIVGELGDGTLEDGLTPVDVVGLTSGVTAVTTGADHACALITTGRVKCWGYNKYGQLGDGTTEDKVAPVDITDRIGPVTAIFAGGYHTCILTPTGGAKCWGNNRDGQLGDGTTEDKIAPTDVVGLNSGAAALIATYGHTCAITTTGGAKCWGRNDYGQLGDGTKEDKLTPVDVAGLDSGVAGITTFFSQVCALTTDGDVKCWGYNLSGQLGDGTTEDRLTPTAVVGLDDSITAVTTGAFHTCALTTTGRVKCWGTNRYGELGDGAGGLKREPVGVDGLDRDVAVLAAGAFHTCALTSAGGAKCWGRNDAGQLGDNTLADRHAPADVVGLERDTIALAAGSSHTCALTAQGGAECWGLNSGGQLGDGTTESRSTPVGVAGLNSGLSAIVAGESHTCALTNLGGVKCWGSDQYGQLGDGTVEGSLLPVDVIGLSSGVVAIAAGGHHTCALTSLGGVKCWGYNNSGQLGDFTTFNQRTPVDVVRLDSPITAITAGLAHTCALTTAGGIKCWGGNSYGQLGDGTRTVRLVPVDVTGLTSGVTAISASTSTHTCAVLADGGIRCWGRNDNRQLGTDTPQEFHIDHSSVPVDVDGPLGNMASVTTGDGHTCALSAEGAAICWGSNIYGQLGTGSAGSLTPVDVLTPHPFRPRLYLPILGR